MESARHDALLLFILQEARDRVRLACACLPIGKNRAVVPLQHVFAHGEGRFGEDVLLLRAENFNVNRARAAYFQS